MQRGESFISTLLQNWRCPRYVTQKTANKRNALHFIAFPEVPGVREPDGVRPLVNAYL